MAGGWIKLHYKIMECWVWHNPLYLKAWLHILFSANYKDKRLPFNGEVIIIQRGQFITSQRKLAEEWGCSVVTVRKILSMMEKDGMITLKTDNKKTLLTVVNYDVYQLNETQGITQTITQSSTQDITQSITQAFHNIRSIDNNIIQEEKKIEKESILSDDKIPKKAPAGFNLEESLSELSWSDSMKDTIRNWFQYKKERRKTYTPIGAKSLLTTVQNAIDTFGEQAVIDQIVSSIGNQYQGMGLERIKAKPIQAQQPEYGSIQEKWENVLYELERNNEVIDADRFDVSDLETEGS